MAKQCFLKNLTCLKETRLTPFCFSVISFHYAHWCCKSSQKLPQESLVQTCVTTPGGLPSAGTCFVLSLGGQGSGCTVTELCLQCGAVAPGTWGKTWPPSSGLRGGPPVEQGAVLACTVFLGPGESSDLCLKEGNRTCERWERKALAQRRLLSGSDSMFSLFT